MTTILGIQLDEAGRCYHYHSNSDVVALKCDDCKQFYACYHCHNQLEEHPFQAIAITDSSPVLCGKCQTTLSFTEYQKGNCPHCHHPFNPNCKHHYTIYFKGDLHD